MTPLWFEIAASIALALGGGIGGHFIGCAIQRLWARRQAPTAAPEKLSPETQAAIKGDILAVAEWTRWNPWYHADQVLALEAQSIHMRLQQIKPGQPLEENLADVTAEMRRRYPEIMTLN